VARTLVVRPLEFEFASRHRRHERIGVDLTVGVLKGRPYFDAAVFEGKYVLNPVLTTELVVAVGPDVDQQFDMPQRQCSQ
jgi:hypothetical protein